MADLQHTDTRVLDELVGGLRGTTEEDRLELARAVRWAIQARVPAAYGFPGPKEWLEGRHRLAWRAVHPYLSLLRAVDRLPTQEAQKEATARLLRLGIERATLLLPLVRPGWDWEGLADRAEQASLAALREWVRVALGRSPAEHPDRADQRLYRHVLEAVPPERRGEVERVVEAIWRVTETKNFVAVLLWLIDSAKVEVLAREAATVGPSPTETEEG